MAVEEVQQLNGHGLGLSNGSASSNDVVPAPYVLKPPEFSVHVVEESVMGQQIAVEVLKMKDSVYIWAGSASNKRQENMSLSIPTRFHPMPLTTSWIGEPDSTASTSQKISTKLKKPVVLSFNIADNRMVPHVEKIIFDDIKNNPSAY